MGDRLGTLGAVGFPFFSIFQKDIRVFGQNSKILRGCVFFFEFPRVFERFRGKQNWHPRDRPNIKLQCQSVYIKFQNSS